MGLRDDLKILIAEDDKINQRLASIIFSQLSLKCDIASNGLEAFEMHRKAGYDLIFMDLHMPVLDGYEATRLIRAYENKMNTRNTAFIVALTASELKEKKDECIKAGMNDFLEKPFKNKVLINLINNSFPKQL